MYCGPWSCDVRLYQSYVQPAEPSTEQVSVTVPHTGMMVVAALSVAFGLFAVQFREKTTQVHGLNFTS